MTGVRLRRRGISTPAWYVCNSGDDSAKLIPGMLAVGRFGSGRGLAYISDPAPHWGCNFVYWDRYARPWANAVDWLVS